MAEFRLKMMEPVQRSKGRSAVAAAAYRAGTCLHDERLGETHDYTRKQGVLYSEIILPPYAPQIGLEREAFWNGVEKAETRKNSQVAREIIANLPHELPEAIRQEIAVTFAHDLTEQYGLGVDVSLHEPSRQGDQRNFHAHFLLTTRRADPESATGWGEKARELDAISERQVGREGDEITHLRERFALLCNRELERLDIRNERGELIQVDHHSYDEQGIDREPTIKEGVAATAIKRRGEHSTLAAENEAIKQRNAEREELAQQIAETQDELKGLINETRRTPLFDQLQWRFRDVPELAALFETDHPIKRDQAEERDRETVSDSPARPSIGYSPYRDRNRATRELNDLLDTAPLASEREASSYEEAAITWLSEIVLQIPVKDFGRPYERFLGAAADIPSPVYKDDRDVFAPTDAGEDYHPPSRLQEFIEDLSPEDRGKPAARLLEMVANRLIGNEFEDWTLPKDRSKPFDLSDKHDMTLWLKAFVEQMPEADRDRPAARFLEAVTEMAGVTLTQEETRAGEAEGANETSPKRTPRYSPHGAQNEAARVLNALLNEPEPKEPNPLADKPEDDPARRLLDIVAEIPAPTPAEEAQKRAEERRKQHEKVWDDPDAEAKHGPAERLLERQVFGGGRFGIS